MYCNKEGYQNFNGTNQNHGHLQRQLKASKNREKNLQVKIKKQTKEYDELYAIWNKEEHVRTHKMTSTFCILKMFFVTFQKNITLRLKNDKLTEDLKVTKDREERVVSEAKEFAVKSSKTKEELFAKLSEAYQVK